MLIKREVLEAIKAGQITLQFRRWTRPSVKAGGTLKTRVGLLRIGRIDEMRPEDVTAVDARKAGFRDIADFRAWLTKNHNTGNVFVAIGQDVQEAKQDMKKMA